MSLVLEALRRVEKPGGRTGSVGAAVASFTPAPKRRGISIPLFLGLAAGAIVFLLFDRPVRRATEGSMTALPGGSPPAFAAFPSKGGASLPPPLIRDLPLAPRTSTLGATRRVAALPAPIPSRAADLGRKELKPSAPLVLQAISERDSHPIAVISDQLVREGDQLGAVRVLRIGAEFVDIRLDNGLTETLRFPVAPPPEASPSLAIRP